MPPRIQLLLANRAYSDHTTPRSVPAAPAVGAGGLVAAVHSLIEPWDGAAGTTWVAAGRGAFDREWTDADGFEILDTARGPLHQQRLYFGDDAWDGHYTRVSNAFLWPLLHLVRERLPEVTGYFPPPECPDGTAWQHYVDVNATFAQAALRASPSDQTCWVHDYQLALVPQMLRERGYNGRIGYFLHTPFPDIDIAAPYLTGEGRDRFAAFVGGILGADLAGFQTEADAERFRRAATALDVAVMRDGALWQDVRRIETGAFPVSIDTAEIEELAGRARLSERFEAMCGVDLPVVVGLERADYTKGIPERLRTIASAYRAGLHFTYIGAAAPTRAGVRAYEKLNAFIATAAVEAEEAAAALGVPFLQLHESIPWDEVVALQREADVVFTSSLADGMNLVPLQAAVAQAGRAQDKRGVIVTGRDAGVAQVYDGYAGDGLAIVNPLDSVAMGETLQAALAGRPGRISDRLIETVRRRDAHAWATGFLTRLEAAC